MRRWSTAIVLGVVASVLIAIPAYAGDEAPERHQVRAQEQVQEDVCAGDCDPARDQDREQTRTQIRTGDVACEGECSGDAVRQQTRTEARTETRADVTACDGDCEAIRDRIRSEERSNAMPDEGVQNLLMRIRMCLAADGDDCPDPAAVAARIRAMLVEEELDLPQLCLRLWHGWRMAL